MVNLSASLRGVLLPLLLAPLSGICQETWTQNFEDVPDESSYAYVKSGSGQLFSTADGANYVAGGTRSFGAHNNTGTGPVGATLDFDQVTFSTDGTTFFTFRLAAIENNATGGLDQANGSIQVNIGYNGGPLLPTLRIIGSAAEPTWNFTANGTAAVTVSNPTPSLTTLTAQNGSSGFSTVRVNFGSAIYRARVQVVLSASPKTDLVIDNAQMSSNGPLPVELTSFKSSVRGTTVGLHWATASEHQCAWFEVQRKAPGSDSYATIGKVRGQGTSLTPQAYTFSDEQPRAGQAYYRLRQVDEDGQGTFSAVLPVRWQPQAPPALYPNPTRGLVCLPDAVPVSYRVLSTQGHTLLRGEATDRLNVEQLPAGSYFLELRGAAGTSVQRLLRE